MIALGAAAAVAYKLWKQKQTEATAPATYSYDDGAITPPHGDPLLDRTGVDLEPEPAVSAYQSSRGFGTS
ncbi:MAG TPA: hypothetical protein DDZ67_07640 [Xanthomonadaceae bacterium]|nr:hypothetical protein [Xanthomonadaceae bacterium]